MYTPIRDINHIATVTPPKWRVTGMENQINPTLCKPTDITNKHKRYIYSLPTIIPSCGNFGKVSSINWTSQNFREGKFLKYNTQRAQLSSVSTPNQQQYNAYTQGGGSCLYLLEHSRVQIHSIQYTNYNRSSALANNARLTKHIHIPRFSIMQKKDLPWYKPLKHGKERG